MKLRFAVDDPEMYAMVSNKDVLQNDYVSDFTLHSLFDIRERSMKSVMCLLSIQEMQDMYQLGAHSFAGLHSLQ